MAKPASIKIRLNSTADTGFFYVAKKNARTKTDKLVLKKYDRQARAEEVRSGGAQARRIPRRQDQVSHANSEFMEAPGLTAGRFLLRPPSFLLFPYKVFGGKRWRQSRRHRNCVTLSRE
jgi:large subunit ribosomal protein L33